MKDRSNIKWPLDKRIWQKLHVFVNHIAWNIVPTKNDKDPKRNHFLWRLNDFVANRYVHWWTKQFMKGRKRQ